VSAAADSGHPARSIAMLLPDHLPEHGDPATWRQCSVEMSWRSSANSTAMRGWGTDLVVCDYGLRPADRPDGLNWFARVVSASRSGRPL